METLKMDKKELEELGFVEHVLHHVDVYGEGTVRHQVVYRKKTINGYFSYSPAEEKYAWYHVTVMGRVTNNISLKVESFSDLEATLKVFKC